MRQLALLVPLCVPCLACAQPNPNFQLTLGESTEDSDDPTSPTIEGDGDGDGEPGDGDGDGEPGDGDGEPACGAQPSPGLSIELGDPAITEGQCLPYVNISATVLEAAGGVVTLSLCDAECIDCGYPPIPLSMFPLLVDDYIPADGTCLAVEADNFLYASASRCYYGSLSVWAKHEQTPFVIATAHAFPPTATGAEIIGETVPEPVEGFKCDCDAVGQGNECCYNASPPAFYYYPMDGMNIYPGGYAKLSLSNSNGLTHWFKPIQAEHIYTCENTEFQSSWAIVGQP